MIQGVCLVLGYLIGCFQTSFIVGKVKGIDIREHGSGNAGTTNTMRVLGKKAGIIVFIGDILKAVIGCLLVSLILTKGFKVDINYPQLYTGLGVILGHNFPFYMNFKGGKGVASTIGVALFFDIRIGLLCVIFGFSLVALTKYVSLAALLSMVFYVVLTIIFGYPTEAIILVTLMAAMAFYQHIGNIKRLIEGTENKFTFGKQKDAMNKK